MPYKIVVELDASKILKDHRRNRKDLSDEDNTNNYHLAEEMVDDLKEYLQDIGYTHAEVLNWYTEYYE